MYPTKRAAAEYELFRRTGKMWELKVEEYAEEPMTKVKAYNYAAVAVARDDARALRDALYSADPLHIWQVAGMGIKIVMVRCIGIVDDDEEESRLVGITRRDDVDEMAAWVLRKCDDVPAFATEAERVNAEKVQA